MPVKKKKKKTTRNRDFYTVDNGLEMCQIPKLRKKSTSRFTITHPKRKKNCTREIPTNYSQTCIRFAYIHYTGELQTRDEPHSSTNARHFSARGVLTAAHKNPGCNPPPRPGRQLRVKLTVGEPSGRGFIFGKRADPRQMIPK